MWSYLKGSEVADLTEGEITRRIVEDGEEWGKGSETRVHLYSDDILNWVPCPPHQFG